MSKVVNFRIEEEAWQEFKEIILAERRTIQESIVRLIEEYKKKVKGNPQFTIDQFETILEKSPNLNDSSEKWTQYLKSLNVEEYKEFDKQINMILTLHNKAYKNLL